MFFWRLPIKNHSKTPVTERRRNKAKNLTQNFIRPKFGKTSITANPVKSLRYVTCYSSSSPMSPILWDESVRRSAVDQNDQGGSF